MHHVSKRAFRIDVGGCVKPFICDDASDEFYCIYAILIYFDMNKLGYRDPSVHVPSQ